METKICSSCSEVKFINEFYKGGGKCKICQHAYNKIHNEKNKDKYRKYQRKANKKSYDRGQEFINKHRALCGCQKCGDKRYWVIDYHHLDPSEKDNPITYYKTSTLDVLKKEIKKCIPLCRNCHTDFHYQEKQSRISIEEYLNL
jgi:hypothetical protein